MQQQYVPCKYDIGHYSFYGHVLNSVGLGLCIVIGRGVNGPECTISTAGIFATGMPFQFGSN